MKLNVAAWSSDTVNVVPTGGRAGRRDIRASALPVRQRLCDWLAEVIVGGVGGAGAVVNVMSAPKLVPATFSAAIRKW